jgi:tetratricopeptide (TPR) repeat protein
MSSKKSEGKPSSLELETPDFTSSITETDHEGMTPSNPNEKLAQLLGKKSLETRKEPRVLLRISDGVLRPNLASSLKLPVYQPRRRADELPIPLIMGPFDLSDLKGMAEEGLFRPQDCVQTSFGRWKSVRDIFSDFVESAHTDEITNTMTATATATETSGLDNELEGELELGAVDDSPSESDLTPLPTPTEPEEGAMLDLEDDESDVESIERHASKNMPPALAPAKSAAIKKAPASLKTAKPEVKAATAPQHHKPIAATDKNSSWGLVLILAAVGGAALYLSHRKESTESDKVISVQASGVPHVAVDWPQNLRPQTLESLSSGDSGLVSKIRPILNAYENGTMVMSPNDERILKEVSDPASASSEARRLAANQLAVFYLASSKVEEARQVLAPLMDSGTPDPTTLLNMALLQLTAGEYAEARDSATAALRLVPPANAWIAHSVVGLVEGYRGRLSEAEANFKDALRRSLNNPFVYGLYIRTLFEVPGAKDRIPELIREALWTDPDRLVDSPIRAPLAGHILVSFALEGLVRGAEMRESRLSPGKTAFVKWLEARYRRNPLSQPIGKVREILSREEDSQSQLLYAFTLQEQGKLDEASDVMTRVTALLQSQEDMRSSFPWSFAGDVHYARRNTSQAIVLYQNALSRNARDVAAVLGMALAFRDSGEYKLAEQKLAEALSLDPFFIPALLRISRFEWHGGNRTQ